ncbi:MAG: hypothetical protein VW554_02655, partial [Alphaproteobacteria bacterium]
MSLNDYLNNNAPANLASVIQGLAEAAKVIDHLVRRNGLA